MKNILLTISFLFLSLVAFCQPTKAEGTLYFNTIAEMNNYAPVPPLGTEVVYCVEDSTVYTWNRIATNWSSITDGVIDGNLTTNYIPFATGANSLGNSDLFYDGTNFGINKTTGLAGKLHINNSSGIGLYVSPTGSGRGIEIFGSGSTEALKVQQFSTANTMSLRAGTGRAIQITTNPTSINHSTIASISNSSLGTGIHLISDYSQRSNVTVTDGFGMYNSYNLENELGTYNVVYRRDVSWVNVANREAILNFRVLGNIGYSDFKFYGEDVATGFAKFNFVGKAELPDYGVGNFTGTATQLLGVNVDGDVIETPVTNVVNHTYNNAVNEGVDLILTGSVLNAELNIDAMTDDPSPAIATTYLPIQTTVFGAKKISIEDLFTRQKKKVSQTIAHTARNVSASGYGVNQGFVVPTELAGSCSVTVLFRLGTPSADAATAVTLENYHASGASESVLVNESIATNGRTLSNTFTTTLVAGDLLMPGIGTNGGTQPLGCSISIQVTKL